MTTAPSTVTNELDDMVERPVTPQADGTFFGEVVTLDASAWKLVKGRGRILFDPTHDDPADRVRGITIVIQCERKDGSTFTIDTGRQPLLEIDVAWHKHLLPSIKKTGVALSTLLGKYVQVKRVPTGETYVNKASGETKQKTALEFVAAYPDLEALQAARTAHYGGARSSSVPASRAAAVQPPTIDKAALEKLLPALWAASGKNEAVFKTMFEANPTLTAAFTYQDALDAASLPF